MELQSRKMRLVFGGSERDAEADVHGADERIAIGKTGDDRADESFSGHQGFGDRCLMEFSGEEKNQAVQAATARCAGRHMAHAAGGHRSCPGIPEMHRMFSLPGRLPRSARSPDARQIHRAALSNSCRRAGDAPARYGGSH